MNIGDKVRLLHGNESGVIVKISASGRVEVEIEDGFRIPAMKNEIVVISSAEKQYFGDQKEVVADLPNSFSKVKTSKEEGLFIAYLPLNDKDHSIYISNNSDRDYILMATEVFGSNGQTIFAGMLKKKTTQKLGEKSIQDFEEWPMLLVQFFPIHSKIEKMEPSFERRVKFKASSFFKSRGTAPILDKSGYVFKLSDQTKEIDIQKLNEQLNTEKTIPVLKFQKPPREIDLHIEQLTKDFSMMSNGEMVRLQMETFEKNLNYAIASGMDEITFIHGIGNGVLRKEIHKYLSHLGNIKYFQDTQKSRFGYGATLVRIS
ncbi:Smr/MutS family protein [Aquiflexum gelatinilyticum]|uniref:Smr/MutS family protein n=1 Tax=Aquiflexum gelatinilyticum TaxID=2961943 RepID=A0A9X2SZ95_9BACT|nr:Smr/MutS family protein [Aquiflexum gelatinilyticum]MCR9013671.1 Smr/MutS family protein [Aquiflexum gelatinilyticum]